MLTIKPLAWRFEKRVFCEPFRSCGCDVKVPVMSAGRNGEERAGFEHRFEGQIRGLVGELERMTKQRKSRLTPSGIAGLIP